MKLQIDTSLATPAIVNSPVLSSSYNGLIEVQFSDGNTYIDEGFHGSVQVGFYSDAACTTTLQVLTGLQFVAPGFHRGRMSGTLAAPACFVRVSWVDDLAASHQSTVYALPIGDFPWIKMEASPMLAVSQDSYYSTSLSLPNANLSAVEWIRSLDWVTSVDLSGNKLTRIEEWPFGDALTSLNVSGNLLTYVPSVSGLAMLTTIDLSGNALPVSIVQQILDDVEAMVVATGATGGTLNLSGGTNGVPSDLTPKTTLEGYLWTVTVNS